MSLGGRVLTVKSASKSVVLLRHWFDSAEQALRHVHDQQKRALLFFGGAVLAEGARVLLELALRSSDQSCVLHGQVIAVHRDGASGSWLSLADAAKAVGLADAAGSRRRRARRIPIDVPVAAGVRTGLALCRLVDVSATGGRLAGLPEEIAPGAVLPLSTFGGPATEGLGSVEVVWRHGAEAGVRFQREAGAAQAMRRLGLEASGPWMAALETAHPAFCRCPQGPLQEPPLPVPRQQRAAAAAGQEPVAEKPRPTGVGALISSLLGR